MRKSKKRIEMGEDAWEEYQIQRKRFKANKHTECHPEKIKARNKSVVKCRNKKKQILVEYKGGQCEHCGFKTEIMSVYDFHHKDPKNKDFAISSRQGYCKSIELAKLEVDKCLLLCRNCHAIEHDRLFKSSPI
jgi:hypothetical protein